MMEAKDLNPKLWDEDIKCDAYVQNKSQHKSLDGKTPYEALSGHKPSVSHFSFLDQRLGIGFLPRRERP